MNDPILNARLDVLARELALTNDTTEWQNKLGLAQINMEPEKSLGQGWIKFTTHLGSELKKQNQNLTIIRASLKGIEQQDGPESESVMNQAWDDYGRVLERSQALFREFLEFLGALIFRGKKFDADICEVADELIKSCAIVSQTDTSIAVPVARDALAISVGRMVRVRFPEWSIWTLPFTAYEYGHVVFNASRMHQDFKKDEVQKWLDADPEFQALSAQQRSGEDGSRLRLRAETYVGELLADIFATHLMGPAYACSAILLRFDPSGASNKSNDRPEDTLRAHLVFTLLEMMSQESALRPYDPVIHWLAEGWKAANARASATRSIELEASDKARVKMLVEDWTAFTTNIPSGAKYPYIGADGWGIAGQWAEHWKKQLANYTNLTIPPDIKPLSKLRDVLNAAWLCRYEVSQSGIVDSAIQAIARVALELCIAIRNEIDKESFNALRARMGRIPGEN